jgi:hypothetical protein
MKKYKLFILLIGSLIFGQLSAQEPIFSEGYKTYASYTNLAELSFCRNNIAAACLYYDSAFLTGRKAFNRDLFNYAHCQQLLGKDEIALPIFKQLYIENYRVNSIKNCIDTTLLLGIKQKHPQSDPELAKVISKMVIKDQNANAKKYGDMQNNIETLTRNMDKLIELIKAYESDTSIVLTLENTGWLHVLHFFQAWDLSNKAEKNPRHYKNYPAWAILKEINFSQFAYLDFLIEQTEKGNYDPSQLARMIELSGVNTGTNVIMQYGNFIIVNAPHKLKDELLVEINTNRKKYCLESYKDYYFKTRYADSLLTQGHAFKVITEKDNHSFYQQLGNSCQFIMPGQYRMNLYFNSPGGGRHPHLQHIEDNFKE